MAASDSIIAFVNRTYRQWWDAHSAVFVPAPEKAALLRRLDLLLASMR